MTLLFLNACARYAQGPLSKMHYKYIVRGQCQNFVEIEIHNRLDRL